MMETKGLSREKSFLHSRMTKKIKLFFLPGCFGTYILCDSPNQIFLLKLLYWINLLLVP